MKNPMACAFEVRFYLRFDMSSNQADAGTGRENTSRFSSSAVGIRGRKQPAEVMSRMNVEEGLHRDNRPRSADPPQRGRDSSPGVWRDRERAALTGRPPVERP